MNAVLQCLTHTAPLAEVLLSLEQPLAPEPAVVMTHQHIRRALTTNGVVAPSAHARALKLFNKR